MLAAVIAASLLLVGSSSGAANASSLTWSYTVPSKAMRVLVVGVQSEDASTTSCQATNVTYGGTSLTRISQAVTSSSSYQCASLWYMSAPPVGSANVAVSFGSTMDGATGYAITLSNVKQGAPDAKAAGVNNTGAVTTGITTVTPNSTVIDVFGSGQSQGDLAPSAAQTLRAVGDAGGGATTSGGMSTKVLTSAGSTSMAWTQSGINRSASVVAAFAPGDTTPPTNAVTLASVSPAGAAYLSNSTIYYRGGGGNAGSLQLGDAVADSGAGPASATFGALTGSTAGWTHAAQTVVTPSGGPYVSTNAYAWASGTTSSPTAPVVGSDAVDNQATTSLSLVNDSTPPTGGAVSVPGSSSLTTGVTITTTSFTDAGSGIAGNVITRSDPQSPSGSATCPGSGYTGSTAVTSPDAVPTDGMCYVYTLTGTDNVGNTASVVSSPLFVASPAPPPPPPAATSNDSFSGATLLKAATGSYFGSNADATKESGEPDHTGNAGGASVWYQWVAPYSGLAGFDTFGSGLDSLLAVYTGSSVDALTLVAQNDDALGWKWTSSVGFAATAGTTYYIALDGYNDGTGPAHGSFSLNWDLTPSTSVTQPNDNFASAVSIDGPAGSTSGSTFAATKEAGEPAHAAVGGGRSVWFRWTAPYDGQFAFATDGSSFNTVIAAYTGVAVNALAEAASNDDIAWNDSQSRITLTATQGTVYSIAVDGWKASYSGTASGPYILAWQPLSAPVNVPANDWLLTAQQLTGASGAANGSTITATKEWGEPLHAGNAGGASVWYSWTAPASGNVDISTAGSTFDTLLAVYTGSTMASLVQVGANDDIGPGKGPSEVVFAATAGVTYQIAVDGYLAPGTTSAARGDVVLSWSVAASAAPPNDGFESATTLTGVGGVVNRSSLGATKQPGEPAHASNPGGASVWFRWTAPSDGMWRFYTSGSSFNTLLSVYTGDSVDALSQVGSSDDVSATDRSSSVTILARAQTTYWIAVDGYKGAYGPAASGDYSFLWELLGPDPALASNDDFASAWQLNGPYGPVTASNVASTKQAGEPSHAGNGGGASVWFKWQAPSTGQVYFDTPGSSFDTLLAVYTGTSLADLRPVAANDDITYNTWWPTGQYRESYASFIAQQGTWYYIAVDGRAAPGGAPARGSIYLDWWLSPPAGDATLFAAGDVHAACDGTNDDGTAQLLAADPNATIAADGDLADPGSTDAAFANCYDPTWGAFKARTRPAVGNHEYDYSPTAASYFSYFGAMAGAPAKGYYSYELGGWHVIVLNSNCDQVGGCSAGSPEYAWLQQDLTANVNTCTLAYWHNPMFASSDLATTAVRPFWDLLYQAGADVIVNAHARQYERFAPMTPAGVVDNTRGIREFVVGTGGGDLLPIGAPAANSEAVNNITFGLLKLTLHSNGYDWQFVGVPGSWFSDTGHGSCAGGSTGDRAISAAPPAAPVAGTSLSKTGQFSVSWKPSPDLPTGAVYSLFQRSTNSTTYSLVAGGLTGTTYTFDSSKARPEGTLAFRVQASVGARFSAYSPDSGVVVVDKSVPLPPSLKPDRAAEYPAGGWWKDQVTVSSSDNGDAVLADGTPGSGVDKRTLIAPVAYKTGGTFTVSDQVSDFAGWNSLTSSLTVKVDTAAPTITLKCPSYAANRARVTATFTASDAQSGLATPASGSVTLDTSSRGSKTFSMDARDRVGHVKTVSCTYSVY